MRPAATGDPNLRPLTFLIAFGVADAQYQPLRREAEILAVKRHEFRAPQTAGEAGQQQRPVTQARKSSRPSRIIATTAQQQADFR